MLKRITLKAIEKEIGNTEMIPHIGKHQAFLMVYGAAEWLGDKALAKGTRITEVEYPSRVQMERLAKEILLWAYKG